MIKNWLRWLLWKISGRDVLVLRPDWMPLVRSDDYVQVGQGGMGNVLPLRYNFHTGQPWNLRYHIPGFGSAWLEYRLRAPGKHVFCEVRKQVTLPFDGLLVQGRQSLSWNDEPVGLVPGKTVPRDALWLEGHFSVTTADGLCRQRTAGHRVRLHQDQAGTIDQNYFNGDVYQNYEMSSGMFPSQILERIADYRALEGRLLDVGCATGQLVEHACQQKLDAEGVDVSAWAVARAQERNGNRCRVLNLDGATKADFAAPYDIVVLHSVLEHLAEPARALRLLFEITRPGAIVYIQTLNADSLLHLLQKESWSGYSDYTHLSPWITRDWLGDEATRAGFEVRQLKCYGVWNDNRLDPAWRSFGALLQTAPTNVLLEEQFGDFTEAILQRPHQA